MVGNNKKKNLLRFTRNICCPTKIPNVAYIVIFVRVYILYTDQGINGAPYRDWIKSMQSCTVTFLLEARDILFLYIYIYKTRSGKIIVFVVPKPRIEVIRSAVRDYFSVILVCAGLSRERGSERFLPGHLFEVRNLLCYTYLN